MSDHLLVQREVTLLEVLERVLDKGVVIAGDLTISVAGVDLIYLGLRALLCSVETMEQARCTTPTLASCELRVSSFENQTLETRNSKLLWTGCGAPHS